MLKYDDTRGSTVVTCEGCPAYADLASDALEGRRMGGKHEELVHPGTAKARDALHAMEARRQ